MTNERPVVCHTAPMTRNPIRHAGRIALLFLLPLSLRAEDPALRDLLRDALYAEEVTRDPAKAAEQYEKLLALHEEQRPFAATALFRLAEVRRKQDRTEEAIQLYQRLIREFPTATAEVKLAAGNLSVLGAKVPAAGDAMSDEETKELLRLQGLATTGPDVLKDPETLETATGKGWLRVTEFLLEAGNDPYRSSALTLACSRGYLQICRVILDKRGLPPAEFADEALNEAVGEKRTEILKLFLDKGFDVNRALALSMSVAAPSSEWSREITELLVSRGADLDRMPAQTRLPAPSGQRSREHGTPLHDALVAGNIAAASFLLERGCKPDLPTPDHGITPLHIAAASGSEGMDAIVQRLLQAGADPNRFTATSSSLDTNSKAWSHVSPMSLAQSRNKRETMRLLLAGGADPKQPDVLFSLIRAGDEEMLKLFLDAGADPNARVKDELGQEETLLNSLLGYGYSDPDKKRRLFEILLSHGAKPSETWIANGFSGAPEDIRKLLYRRFVYPEWAKLPQVTGCNLERSIKLAEKTGDVAPANLAALHAAARMEIVSRNLIKEAPQAANVIRFKEDGSFSETFVDFTKDETLPPLAWGDVVEFTSPPGGNVSATAFAWHMRRYLSATVTVEVAGEKKAITLRGNRLVFDVTDDELPWSTAGQLMDLYWQTGVPKDDLAGKGAVITVTRKNWPELRLDLPSEEAQRFEVQTGDHLTLTVPPSLEKSVEDERKTGVTVTAPGFPYMRFFRGVQKEDAEKKTLPPLLPTLAQVLAELYGGESAIDRPEKAMPAGDAGFLGTLIPFSLTNNSSNAGIWGITVLPYPDLGDLRIQRRNEDGTLSTIKVDWSAMIGASESISAEEVKKADVTLLPGDVVELRVRANRPNQEWLGFSPKEESFLAKALQGTFQMIDPQAAVSLQQINYKAPAYLETPAGWLPTTPEAGVASVTGDRVLGRQSPGSAITINRDGIDYGPFNRESAFLRDGDVVKFVQRNSPAVRPRTPRLQPPVPTQPTSR